MIFVQSHFSRGLVNLLSHSFAFSFGFSFVCLYSNFFELGIKTNERKRKRQKTYTAAQLWILVSARHITVSVSGFSLFQEDILVIIFLRVVLLLRIIFKHYSITFDPVILMRLVERKFFPVGLLVRWIARISCCERWYPFWTTTVQYSGRSPITPASTTSFSFLRGADQCQDNFFKIWKYQERLVFSFLLLLMHIPVGITVTPVFKPYILCFFCTSIWRLHGNQMIFFISGSAHC